MGCGEVALLGRIVPLHGATSKQHNMFLDRGSVVVFESLGAVVYNTAPRCSATRAQFERLGRFDEFGGCFPLGLWLVGSISTMAWATRCNGTEPPS